ncbi:NACHT domain-containing protein [Psychroserpens sp. Hel_I_66]|uniref:NACHT domain-containing protein n=1 Tax=Psychroserpens sp. Hel_I_66 TaxID=1250004 RepID=UPI00064823D4|nr:hypothetical protein [Psychroserpens sp. Hel_I_66]
MDYLFENLGDERFQEICHALINSEFPNSQAFPVGQPDGGRDSIVYLTENVNKEFIVFQIKYVKNPNKDEPHKWLTKILKKESKKIEELIPKGAKKFYLMTNARGTAHLDAGSIDKVNKILEENISIPSICWWRDDISRKLESKNDIKWSYSEILNGQDVLNNLVFENINENRDRRESVIKAYLKDQYDIDNEVKFKQIELQNKLLDLFTDVPINIKKINEKNKILKNILISQGLYQRYKSENRTDYEDGSSDEIGAASFILNSNIQKGIKRVLIEGGPGQGKSTISQYVCQIHRIKLLNKKHELTLIPKNISESPVRLPFKIDLRDIALWVERKNPYNNIISDEKFASLWQNTLESFLIAHISYHSGLDDFNTLDLISVLKLSSVLFIFDGFDEVANLKSREAIIIFINKGISRLSENTSSIQVVITSRPAAFSSIVGFSIDLYPHFELTDITPSVINEYVEKWIKSRKLDNRKASEIRNLVNEKLKVPHLKDLAKSPMQLAILISLLNTRGESLPNKRTALYDSYIELFFNRESEKSFLIRDNRDLIIDIHEYLAWVLHSEAELYRNSGRIEIQVLHEKLNHYLVKEGHKNIIAEQLFKVMEERVCALVSRVQGTFEFEVQPLREYFAAKYLYNTSPYSPPGKNFPGTKPDRFDAISKNLYWQNVCRFFAGCFDKGELPMIIEKLNEMQEDEHLKYTNYPRLLTSQLLSDYVFTQYPRLLNQVVKLIVSEVQLGKILNQNERGRSDDSILLPIECGRLELVTECFNQLKLLPSKDYAEELIGIINNNPLNKIDFWKNSLSNYSNKDLTKWLEFAYKLRIIFQLENDLLLTIINESESEKTKRLQYLIHGNKEEVINENIELKDEALSAILNKELFYSPGREMIKSFGVLTIIFHSHVLSMAFKDVEYDRSFLNIFDDFLMRRPSKRKEKNESILKFECVDKIDEKISNFVKDTKNVLEKPVSTWINSIENWDIFTEKARKHFGDNLTIEVLAIISANIKTKDKRFDGYENLNDNKLSLCKRVCSARMKSGNLNYWTNQFTISEDLNFTLFVFLTWATPRTIIKLSEIVSEKISELNSTQFLRLDLGLSRILEISSFTSTQIKFLEQNFNHEFSNEFKYLLMHRVPYNLKNKFVYNNIRSVTGKLNSIFDLKLEFLIDTFLKKPSNKSVLLEIKKIYSKATNFNMNEYRYRRAISNENHEIPVIIAKMIMEEDNLYPKYLVSIAENVCWRDAINKKKKVGNIAIEEKWFDYSVTS